jgi:hypothetical protein
MVFSAKFTVIVVAIPNPGHKGVTEYMEEYADEVKRYASTKLKDVFSFLNSPFLPRWFMSP